MLRALSRCLLLFALLVLLGGRAAGQETDAASAELERYVRDWYAAWDSGDPDRIVAFDDFGPGYGFRTFAIRPVTSKEEYRQGVEWFLSLMESYHLNVDELHVSVDGDVGLAWGVHSEEFQMRGREPESVRVRFTMTLKKDPAGWRPILFHRDIQPFDERGYYIPATGGEP